jgi:hypothetical protein
MFFYLLNKSAVSPLIAICTIHRYKSIIMAGSVKSPIDLEHFHTLSKVG